MVDLKETVSKFKISMRDGVADLIADVESYIASASEAKALRDLAVKEFEETKSANEKLMAEMEAARKALEDLENKSAILRKAIASVANVNL